MEGTELKLDKERLTEDAGLVSTSPSATVVLKPGKIDEFGYNQKNQQVTVSPVKVTRSSTQKSHTSSDIRVTLENESVWNRFHSLGTEMILTKQGRRMFPCCRFRLSGLDLQRKYFLVMDIMPLDEFTYRWNGKSWEPVAVDESHLLGQICVHPESPAVGQQWMDSPVSFYKVKLTNDSTDQEGCVILRPMHRYLPRLRIVPFDTDSERTIELDGPKVKIFSFPQTEFYAVTSYQNPQITQLKIDCNPFAMAFREDSQSIRLLQDKLKPCSSVSSLFQSPLLSLAQKICEKRKKGAAKSNRTRAIYPKTDSVKEGEGIFTKLNNAILSCPNTDYSENDRGTKTMGNKCPSEPVLDDYMAPLEFEPSEIVSLEESMPGPVEPVPPISSSNENSKSSEAFENVISSQKGCMDSKSPTESSMSAQSSQTQGETKSAAVFPPRPPFLNASQVHEQKPGHTLKRRPYHRSRKAKSKWWSKVKHKKNAPAAVPQNVTLHPDLEDVEGMLFVSFVAKEALNIKAENVKETKISLPPPSSTHEQTDSHEVEDVSLSVAEQIAKLEKTLLLHLKQQKHRQVIHPCLQHVGMKLSLLDPKLPIDLQYLGVHLPLPSPILEGLDKINLMSRLSSPDAAGIFVSRTGKTNDLTKIKGWREKFKTNSVPSAPEGLKNSSAFCSEMLDAYLENEAQQISDRVAVFSQCSASPVSYQLPSKSSSYVVTLDSLLKTRSGSSNKAYSKPMDDKMPFRAQRHAGSTFQGSRSMRFVSRRKKQLDKSLLSAETTNHISSPMIPVKVKNKMLLHQMEKEAIFRGKNRTHITTERATFALTSLLNFMKKNKRPKFRMHLKNENACAEVFCLLGCVCDSLERKIRGPTHCRRVECMFECNCFKHKVLLLRPPEVTPAVQRGRKRSVLAFPIADPEREPRPPPAPSVSSLWKMKTGEYDPEPIFIPVPPVSSKYVSSLQSGRKHSSKKVPEEDKDPVYLYFESMMTCARVREYNSNPPLQIHMFPTKKDMKEPEQFKEIGEAGEPPFSQKIPETNPTEMSMKPNECIPTKLLEILSECNWEPHRNLVLSTLFRRMNTDLLSQPFYLAMYKIQLLSTTIKGVGRSSIVTYKVCISRADEKEMTEDLQAPGKKTMKKQKRLRGAESKVSKTCETQAQKGTADTKPGRKSSVLVENQRKKPLPKRELRPLSFLKYASLGYLKADIRKPGTPSHGLIKVNGKSYSKAKLQLGQLGALHPVNRIAAFVTGRLLPILQDQTKLVGNTSKACPSKALLEPKSITTVANLSNLALANVPEPEFAASENTSSISPTNAPSNTVGPPPGTTPIVPDGTRFVLVPATPSNSAVASSAETVISSTLPPGQQVVLQPVTGKPGSTFLCQYNGQMIQLKPISSRPLHQPPSSVNEGSTTQTAYNTGLPNNTRSLQMPLTATPLPKMLPKPFPDMPPKMRSLSATSGINIVSGMSAFNLQSSFPGKTGTFSFRICPPTAEKKSVGSKHDVKPPELSDSSIVELPGGFTLVKLFNSAVPVVPANVIPSASHPAEILQDDESAEKPFIQSCPPSLGQNCQVSEIITNPVETSNCNSSKGSTDGLNQSGDSFPFKVIIKDEPVENISESVNMVTPSRNDWVTDNAMMVHKSDVSEPESMDMDDWPLNGAERILWIDSADEEENLDVAAEIPATKDAIESKTTTTAVDFSSHDECLHVDNPNWNEKETSKPPHIQKNDLPPDEDTCTTSSYADALNQEKFSDSFINADNFIAENIDKQMAAFLVASNKLSQISFGSSGINEQVMIQEESSSVFVKTELFNKLTETDVTGNKPNIKDQDLLVENSTLDIGKKGNCNNQAVENVFLDHISISEQRLDSANNNNGISIKKESCNDSPKTDTRSVHDDEQHIGSENILPVVNKEPPSMNQMATDFSQDPSKQGLDSKNNDHIFNHKEFYNEPAKPNTTALLQAEDAQENVEIAGNASSSLLDGQKMVNSTPTAQLLNTASLAQKTGLNNLSPLPHNMTKSSPERPDSFDNLSDNCTETSQIVQQDYDDEEIVVNVMNLSEDENPSIEFDRDEDNSSDYSDLNSSDKDNSSNDYISDGETTDDPGDTANEDVDVESFDDNDGIRIISMLKVQRRHEHNTKGAAEISQKAFTSLSKLEYLPTDDLEKRLSHTEKERVRRDEMRHSFAALKKLLNVEERVKLCNHDILNQARLTIWALKDRSQYLEKRKKALQQTQSVYLSKIIELSENIEAKGKVGCKEQREQQKQFDSQNTRQTSVPSPPVNTRRLDSDGNRLPPRFGCWKAPNYIRRRSKKALRQPSITTTAAVDKSSDSHGSSVTVEELIQTLIAQSPTVLPLVHKTTQQKTLPTEHKPTEKRSLPKIVLQSFGKTDPVKLDTEIKTSQSNSTEVSNTAELLMTDHLEQQDQNKRVEKCDATKVSNQVEKTLVSEPSNKESPAPSSAVNDNNVKVGELEKDEQSTVVKEKIVRKNRKSNVVKDEAFSNPDFLGPRQLRRRPPAVTGVVTGRGRASKKKRVI